MFGVPVYRKSEEHELDYRDADNHAEGKAVPPHLDKFLDDDRPETRKRK